MRGRQALPDDITGEQARAVEDVQFAAGIDLDSTEGQGALLNVGWHRADSGPSPLQLELLLTGLALVFALFVVGASLALAAAEAKDERDILTIAGAPPGLLSRAAGARAWILAGLGGVLAVPVGFLPVIVFTKVSPRPGDTPFPLVFPARTAVILVLLVPTIVMLVARSASATAQRLRPVRVSTAAFE